MDFDEMRRQSDPARAPAPRTSRPTGGAALTVGSEASRDERDADALAAQLVASITATGGSRADASGTGVLGGRIRRSTDPRPTAAPPPLPDRIRRSTDPRPTAAPPPVPNRIRRSSAGQADASIVRRKISFTSKNLSKSSTKSKFTTTTWVEIQNHLKLYEGAQPGRDELRHLQSIEMLCKEWLAAHAGDKDESVGARRMQIESLLPQVEAEIDTMGAAQDSQYTDRIRSHRTPGAKHADNPFLFITGSGAKGLTSAAPPRNAPADRLPHGLTAAELAAIRVYTGGDYRTINPTIEGNDEWLERQTHELTGEQGNADRSKNFVGKEGGWDNPDTKRRMEKAKGRPDRFDRRRMKVDAMQHTRVALSGLRKLPSKQGTGYRGFTISKAALDTTYAAGSEITYKPFISTSTKRDISEGYAKLAKAPEVGVLLVLTITDGRDVDDISLAKGEGEILLLPNTKFRVTRAPQLDSPPPAAPGQPAPQSKVWVVEASQVGGAGAPAGNAAPPVPLNALPPTAQHVAPGPAPTDVAPPRPRADALLPPVRPGHTPPIAPTDVAPPRPRADALLAPVRPGQMPPVATDQRPTVQAAPRPAPPQPAPPQPAALQQRPAASHQQAAPADPDAGLRRAADAKAAELIAKAARAEPLVTATLSKLAKKHGSHLEGLEHKLKTQQSLSRKLADRVRTQAVPSADHAGALGAYAMGMNDVLRYTMITSAKDYVKVEAAVTKALAEAGIALSRPWNAWEDAASASYNGINLTFITKDGLLFELQLHTKDSFAAKQETHPLYEEARASSTTPERRKELNDQAKLRWAGVPIPKGIRPTEKR